MYKFLEQIGHKGFKSIVVSQRVMWGEEQSISEVSRGKNHLNRNERAKYAYKYLDLQRGE